MIVPHLWFDKNAEEAVKFYTSLFENSSFGLISHYGKAGFEYHKMPEGSLMTIDFDLMGLPFVALNGGPTFKFTEAISLFLYCESEERIDKFYSALSDGGSVLMPLDKYDWSPKYAWVKDKFGVSWQLDVEKINSTQKIVPTFLFANEKYSKVKDAADFYTSIFPESKIIMEYPAEDSLLFAQFKLKQTLFNAMSGGKIKHDFDFNESISFIIYCDTQEEIDFYWDKLKQDGKEVQCGWLTDKFGISWQIVPKVLNEVLKSGNRKQIDSMMNELFLMKKIEIKKLLVI